MSGRRKHERFALANPWSGHLSVLRDVAPDGETNGLLTVISRTPQVAGEILRLDVSGSGVNATVRVQVIESRPVAVGGSLRHAVRLRVLEQLDERDAPREVRPA
jgi:hypothetical protein